MNKTEKKLMCEFFHPNLKCSYPLGECPIGNSIKEDGKLLFLEVPVPDFFNKNS